MTSKGNFMTIMQMGLLLLLPYAIMNGNIIYWLISVFMYFMYAGFGTVVTMHRLLAHRVFKTNSLIRNIGAFFGTVGSLLTPLEWVQQHLDHHRFVDTKDDPHSPKVLGWKALFFCFHKQGTGKVAVVRLAKEPFMRFLHKWFYFVLISYIGILFFIGGLNLVVFAWAIPSLFALWGQILIVFRHNQEGPTNAGWLIGLLTFGENRHVRHHENPSDISQDGLARILINLIRTDKL